jgi:putative tryptophan/tyrosine transport system substrate-binding protein
MRMEASRCCHWRYELRYTAKILGLTIPASLLRRAMDRRRFLLTSVAGVLAAPLAAGAQQAGKRVPRVGFLLAGDRSSPIVISVVEGFRRGLREHGEYVEGQNIAIEFRLGDLNGANDLVRLNVDVIVAGGTPATLAAMRTTSKIPIVGLILADPVADGLVASLAQPGTNVTGNTFLAPELGPKRLQLLREVVPGVTRVAVLQHRAVYSERTMREMLESIRAAAVGIELQVLEASGPDEFDSAFSAMTKARVGGLLIGPSPMFYIQYRRLVDLAAKHRLPALYTFREAVEAGGLMCYGANAPALARRGAAHVVKILRGAKPAELPVEQPTEFDFLINLKTAKALGLTIPPSLLARADQAIE